MCSKSESISEKRRSGVVGILDAIRAALGPAASTGEPLKIGPDDRHRQSDGAYLNEAIQISLVFANLSADEQAQFIDILNYNAAEPAKSTAQLNFRWHWNEKTKRYSINRWGGTAAFSENAIPEDVLQMLPVTLLGALRDATAALQPGRNSRLAHLLEARANDVDKAAIVEFGKTTNEALEKNDLVSKTQEHITKTLGQVTGKVFAQKTAIKTSQPEFEKIIQGLRLVVSRLLPGNVEITDELRANGLGFNNLFYIATVILELNAQTNALLPLLLVEEPEAHLHPQLQTLLADFLADPKELHPVKVQSLITSHSPTIAAHVPPERLRVLHMTKDRKLHCASFDDCGLTAPQLAQVRRMLDVTRASLLFSRGVILVEGITEALLLPVLARRAGTNLEENGISVVPVCGVDFGTLAALFDGKGLRIPLALVTDGDPGTEDDSEPAEPVGEAVAAAAPGEPAEVPWHQREPRRDPAGVLIVCARVVKLKATYAGKPLVGVFHSDVTLEYSLAKADSLNPQVICDTWTSLFAGQPRTFNQAKLDACGGNHDLQALAIWRGICQAKTTRSKAEFAQALATRLDQKHPDGTYMVAPGAFIIPAYLTAAFTHVLTAPAAEGAH
jgi:putative ATP-dependent endonuclease of the OLD family